MEIVTLELQNLDEVRLAHPFNPDFHFITSKCETCKKYVQINDSKEPALVFTYMVG